MQIKKYLRYTLIPVLTAVIVGCGYQLRGTTGGTLASTGLFLSSSSPYGEFEKQLTRRLKLQNANLTEDTSKAEWHLEIIELVESEQGVSRDQTGRANETELTVKLLYKLTQLSNSSQLSPESEVQNLFELAYSTSYKSDYLNPIGNRNQLIQARSWAYEQLVTQLLRRVNAKVKS
ncbi:MAG: hypothetical protein OQJ89_04220 [Kangiellaceae bacterium]|nr:hypothetical protein [Kangiellaceae bacterium]MCW8999171.1 hypothetical protein [Kangiellaceae bacterium]MCW9016147.1 hypothetical protein [Kangiellaceae bacterium]